MQKANLQSARMRVGKNAVQMLSTTISPHSGSSRGKNLAGLLPSKSIAVIGSTCLDRRAYFNGSITVNKKIPQRRSFADKHVWFIPGSKIAVDDIIPISGENAVKIRFGSPFREFTLSSMEGTDEILLHKNTFILPMRSRMLVSFAPHETIGGNAPNIAVGLKRLGHHTILYTGLSKDDNRAHLIKHAMRDFGIQLKPEWHSGQISQGLILETYLPDGTLTRTIFSRKPSVRYNFKQTTGRPRFILLNSTGPNYQELYRQVISYSRRFTIPLAYAIGSLQLMNKDEIVFEAIKASSILFINKEEGLSLLQGKGKIFHYLTIKELLLKLKTILGPKMVSMTDGKNGAFLIDEHNAVYAIKSFSSACSDPTGAGDAYISGFLSSLLQGYPLPECMRRGVFNASSVIRHEGAENGLLTQKDMNELSQQNPYFLAKLLL